MSRNAVVTHVLCLVAYTPSMTVQITARNLKKNGKFLGILLPFRELQHLHTGPFGHFTPATHPTSILDSCFILAYACGMNSMLLFDTSTRNQGMLRTRINSGACVKLRST